MSSCWSLFTPQSWISAAWVSPWVRHIQKHLRSMVLRDSGCPGFARAAYAIRKDLCHFRYVSPLSQSGSSSACQLSSGLFLKIKKKSVLWWCSLWVRRKNWHFLANFPGSLWNLCSWATWRGLFCKLFFYSAGGRRNLTNLGRLAPCRAPGLWDEGILVPLLSGVCLRKEEEISLQDPRHSSWETEKQDMVLGPFMQAWKKHRKALGNQYT